jgi:hypothetical protein
MPYNGQGLFFPKHVWVNEAAAQTPILPANFDDQANDIAAALSNVITRDGQGGPTSDIPWNNFGITGLRAPLLAGDAANKKYVDDVDAATRVWVGGTTTALPNQAGKAGGALITDGAVSDWKPISPYSNPTTLAQVCALNLALS